MPSFHRHVPTAILLKHLGRSGLIVVLSSLVLVGRLLVWLARAIGWLWSGCRAADG